MMPEDDWRDSWVTVGAPDLFSGTSCRPAVAHTSMRCVLVSHTHWDREWYRTFQSFRSRLVDAIDRVLDLVAEDPSFRFLLDGQTIVLEDYLEIRPGRRAELEAAVRGRRVAIGPWYVQPDSLLPSGESHVRNLLEGRRVGSAFGPVSTVAYTPDSFGHPAQLPQIFAGFGLGPFVYWRGNGDEIAELPAEHVWEAPDGSAVLVHHLGEGYFAATGLPDDSIAAAVFLQGVVDRLAKRARNGVVLLMNGIDHAMPEARAGIAGEALARATGWQVERGLLEDFVASLPESLVRDAPRHRGELVGGRVANLLPGVWSTRTPQKLRHRHAETELVGWAEPWSALAGAFDLPDERPSLRTAWRALLRNQAHDSICGCSQDAVHAQMEARFDEAEELARETGRRALERIAGRGVERRSPRGPSFDVAVFNPSPHPRTDVVRFDLEPDAWLEFQGEIDRQMTIHPLLAVAMRAPGYTIDGRAAHRLTEGAGRRVQIFAEAPPQSVEFVAADVPAFGWKRFVLEEAEAVPATEDEGREIRSDAVAVRAGDDGTLSVTFGERTWRGLGAIEDEGDRGDTYDFDPVAGEPPRLTSVKVARRTHPSGLAWLRVERRFELPVRLAHDRGRRSDERVEMTLVVEARLAEGVRRVDLDVRLENRACDHRLRLVFPTGAAPAEARAATTFDVVTRRAGLPPAHQWQHPPHRTFLHQGFVAAGGLEIGAPGLPEAEIREDGSIAVTLVRSVGWLARMDLRSRPIPAGPMLPTPGAQCLGPIAARLSLSESGEHGVGAAAWDAELGLRAVLAGPSPVVAAGRPLLTVTPCVIRVSACKPASDHDGLVLRLLNPTEEEVSAVVRTGFAIAAASLLRLDETPLDIPLDVSPDEVRIAVPPHALRSVLLIPARSPIPEGVVASAEGAL
jgi:mannosylglycerate hydrolase